MFTELEGGVADDLDQRVSAVTDNVDRIDRLLQESDASTFTVLSTTLTTNYAREVSQLRQIGERHGSRIPPDVNDSIEELVHSLQDIDIARQYFKGVYLQQELAALSRILFYVGLPAVMVVVVALLVFAAGGATFVPHSVLVLLVSVTVTVGLAPLVVLFAYILRTATVTRRTAATIPFTAPEQER